MEGDEPFLVLVFLGGLGFLGLREGRGEGVSTTSGLGWLLSPQQERPGHCPY